MSFKKDLILGKLTEMKVLKRIQTKYPCATIIEGKHKEYDIWIPEIHKSVEVKQDIKSNETGNFVVEIFMYGKPSGLLATKADYWVFSDNEYLYWITPKKIIECILLEQEKQCRFIGKGDTEQKVAYLVKKSKIKKYSELCHLI